MYSLPRLNRCRAGILVRKLSIALALAGLLLGTVLVGWYGFGRVLTSVQRVGWSDFAVICGWQLLLNPKFGLTLGR